MFAGPLLYGGRTVPGMRIAGERLVGSRPIMCRLDELAPEPALLPPVGDPSHIEVLEAERWGDEVLQGVPRRIIDVVSYAAAPPRWRATPQTPSCRCHGR